MKAAIVEEEEEEEEEGIAESQIGRGYKFGVKMGRKGEAAHTHTHTHTVN